MGQKITEYAQVDYWVRLMREADKAGVKNFRRRVAADAREEEKYGQMQRARTRVVAPLVENACETVDTDWTKCVVCGTLLGDAGSAMYNPSTRLRRQTWRPDGSHVNFYACAACQGLR